jgi:hypothetical protein
MRLVRRLQHAERRSFLIALAAVALVAAGYLTSVALAGGTRAATALDAKLSISVTPAARLRGLIATHDVTFGNVGADAATAVVLEFKFQENDPVIDGTVPFGGTCALDPSVTHRLVCTFATLAAGASATMHVTEHLPYWVPYGERDEIILSAGNVLNNSAIWAGQPQFDDRFWWCGLCSGATFSATGWSIPGTTQGFTLDPDDTLHMADGVYISPDGVLHWPDGRSMVVDANLQEHFYNADGSLAAETTKPPPTRTTPATTTTPPTTSTTVATTTVTVTSTTSPTTTAPPPTTSAASTHTTTTAASLLAPPTIAGTAAVGKLLRISLHGLSPSTPITVQWQLCDTASCRPIAGATSPSLKLADRYGGKSVRVVAIATVSGVTVKLKSTKVRVRRTR